MSRFKYLLRILSVTRCFYQRLGLLKVGYDRPTQRYYRRGGCCGSFLLGLLLLLMCLQYLLHGLWQKEVQLLNELEPGIMTEQPQIILIKDWLYDCAYLLLLLFTRKRHLWRAICKAQQAQQRLQPLIGNHWQCSRLVLALAVLQLLLLLAQLVYGGYFLSPSFESWLSFEGYFNVVHYLVSCTRFIIAVVMSLHIGYCLMFAALLQTLNLRLQLQREVSKQLQLLQHLLAAQPLLKSMNCCMASYFKTYFVCYFVLVSFRCYAFVACFTYGFDDILMQQLSKDDQLDMAEWNSLDSIETRTDKLRIAALLLAWHLAMLLVLLCASHVQQRQYQKFMDSIWELHEGLPLADTTHVCNDTAQKTQVLEDMAKPIRPLIHRQDVMNFLLNTNLNIMDYREAELPLLAWKSKLIKPVITIDLITGSCKMLLQLVLFTAVVDFVQQAELLQFKRSLQSVKQQES